MRWPIMPVPGDVEDRFASRPYRRASLVLTRPTLPLRYGASRFRNALPSNYAQVIIGQPRTAVGIRWPFTGVTAPQLSPVITKSPPWQR